MTELLYQSAALTDRGLVRGSNEDAFLGDDKAQLWAVADGMGGHIGGGAASTKLIEFLRSLSKPTAADLTTALHAVNRQLRAQSQSTTPAHKMGTTIALLFIEKNRFLCLWAGDSRVYRLRGPALELLTRDHRYVEDLVDLGLLSAVDADRHPYRNVVTRAVGAEDSLNIASREGNVGVGDKFLLVTDGVSNLCSSDELKHTLLESSIEDGAEKLRSMCIARGAPDNLTAVLVASAAPNI